MTVPAMAGHKHIFFVFLVLVLVFSVRGSDETLKTMRRVIERTTKLKQSQSRFSMAELPVFFLLLGREGRITDLSLCKLEFVSRSFLLGKERKRGKITK